jgi:hypothetical protein
MIGRSGAFLLTVILLQFTARAQFAPRPAELGPLSLDTLGRHNMVSILFDRNLNTYNWIDRISLDTTVLGLNLSFQQQYLSNIIKVEPSPTTPLSNLESNQNSLTLRLGQNLLQDLGVLTEWSSLVYSDNKGVGLSDASFHYVLGGLTYYPLPSVAFNPMAGYRWDNQANNRDRGPTIHIAGRSQGLDVGGYLVNGTGQFHVDYLDPRRLESHFATAGVQRAFSAFTKDSLELGYFHGRREFYTNADSIIESRTENLLTFTNLLDYEILPYTVARLFVNVRARGLDKAFRNRPGIATSPLRFDTRIDEFRLNAFLEGLYRSPDGQTIGSARLSYAERDESHAAVLPPNPSPNTIILWAQRNKQEQTKDNISRRTALTGDISFPLSHFDRLTLSGTASILRYDTPSSLNVEDRDELLVAFRIMSGHLLSRYMEITVSLDANMSKLVYLLKERSANNNTNRVLRLFPVVTYRPAVFFSTTNGFEVLANYTVYDFEQGLAIARSFSYRQFAWIDSTSLQFTERVGLDFFAYLKLYERGQLKWEDFSERTESSFLDQTYALQVRFSPASGTLFAVGFRYFSQSHDRFERTGKTRVSFLRSFGPTCLILWEIGPHSQVSFRGWYEKRTLTDGVSWLQPSMTLDIFVNF